MSVTRRNLLISGAVFGAALAGASGAAMAADQELKIGVVGVLSGPAAQWGLALKGAVEFVAAEANRDGLIKIGGAPYRVSVVAIDSNTERRYMRNETFTHPALKGFTLELTPVFDALR